MTSLASSPPANAHRTAASSSKAKPVTIASNPSRSKSLDSHTAVTMLPNTVTLDAASSSPTSSSSAASTSEPSTPTSNSSLASSGAHHSHSSVVPMYPYNVAMVPQNISGGPMPDDSGITTRLPSICVDYLSHDWAEDDVWTSWKAMTKHKAEIANGVRLENASWRTWAKQRGNLKTISPETLNWLKDSDVTWLYGPLHTSVDAVPPPRIATANERLGLEPLRSLNDAKTTEDKANKATTSKGVDAANSSAATVAVTGKARSGKKNRRAEVKTKPILKHRSLSDILLPPNVTSPVLEEMGMDFSDQSTISIHHARSDSHLVRLNSLNRRKRGSPVHSPRGTSPERSLSDSSNHSTTTNHKPKKASEHRHISFNHRVEQCIAVDSTEDAKKYSAWNRQGGSGSDEDEDDEEDDVLTFRSSPRVAAFGPSALSAPPSQHDREPHTIARLGPTTLKSIEQWPAPSPVVVYQNDPAVANATAGPSKSYSQQTTTNASAVASAAYNNTQAQQAAHTAASAQASASAAAANASNASNPATTRTSKRGPLYDYSNTARTQSEWDGEDEDDYAMNNFDYFTGPDVGVPDLYDSAQYGSTHLIAGTHNDYEAGSPLPRGGINDGQYLPYHNSGSASNQSAASSIESSPNHSRRSSNNSERTGGTNSTSSSPSQGGYYSRGPYAPAQTSRDSATPKRSILKNSGGNVASANDDNAPRLVSSPPTSSPPGGAVTPTGSSSSSSSPVASPYGSSNSLGSVMATAIPQHVRPAGRRSGSDEGNSRDSQPRGETRGRSTSRGSSSSLERAPSTDRRSSSSISPSSYSPPSPSIPGARPVSLVSSRRVGSYESLNVLGSGVPSPASLGAPTNGIVGRQLSDLAEEQSSESESETIMDEDKNSSSITIRKVSPPRSDSNTSTPQPGSSPSVVVVQPPVPRSNTRSRSLSGGEIETVEDVAVEKEEKHKNDVVSASSAGRSTNAKPTVSPERSGLSRQIKPDPILDGPTSTNTATGATKNRPSPVVTADNVPPGPISPPLIPAPTTTPATAGRSVSSTGAGAPRFRQPSPSHPTTSTSTPEDEVNTSSTDSPSFLPSLSNSPALDPTDLAGTQWSDEQVPSFARRSLLRAARGTGTTSGGGASSTNQHRSTGSSSSAASSSTGQNSRDGASTAKGVDGERASIDSNRDTTPDDYGFGYYDDEGGNDSGLLGRTLEVAGTAKDLLGAISKNIWHFGRR